LKKADSLQVNQEKRWRKNKIQKDRRMKGGNKTAKERNTDEKKMNSSGQI
jgi:hypothetical protein